MYVVISNNNNLTQKTYLLKLYSITNHKFNLRLIYPGKLYMFLTFIILILLLHKFQHFESFGMQKMLHNLHLGKNEHVLFLHVNTENTIFLSWHEKIAVTFAGNQMRIIYNLFLEWFGQTAKQSLSYKALCVLWTV